MPKVTAITSQVKSPNRVNIMIDGRYKFSLDVFQVGELGVRVGKEYSEDEIVSLTAESQFGKLYGRALEYVLMRPHSNKEVRDYLYRKTRPTRSKTGELRPGYTTTITERVYKRLEDKHYLNDEKFARWWVESRNLTKGTSLRKLVSELRSKGVSSAVIEQAIATGGRDEEVELQKVIAKKKSRYADDTKLMQYLVRQGFSYDSVKRALNQ